jgi:predicted RNA-binding Zn-ribbon protein involved in translation (DUF1610 family)
MRERSPLPAEDAIGVALCPECGYVGIISRAPEDKRCEFTYRCAECQLAFERRAKSYFDTAANMDPLQ